MTSLGRTSTIFFVCGLLLVGVDFVARGVFHLDCLGPYLYGWGCLFSPFPSEIPGLAAGGGQLVIYGLAAVALWILAKVVGDVIVRLIARWVVWRGPAWAKKQLESQPANKGYRVR